MLVFYVYRHIFNIYLYGREILSSVWSRDEWLCAISSTQHSSWMDRWLDVESDTAGGKDLQLLPRSSSIIQETVDMSCALFVDR